VQGGVNMINKRVNKGKCSIFLNLVWFVCFVLYVSGAYWQHCIYVLKGFCLMPEWVVFDSSSYSSSSFSFEGVIVVGAL
jgi:hypothetical protein